MSDAATPPEVGPPETRLPDACAARARSSGEDPAGTASRVRRWLAVEHPGPWGREALADTRLSAPARRALEHAAATGAARVLFIRRPGLRWHGGPHRVFVAVTTARRRSLQRLEVEALADLAAVDWSPLAAHQPLAGQQPAGDVTEAAGPLLLACAHGRHDPCCAERGRPLARSLAVAEPDATWESSHVGGCRFAANLVVLPEGLYYGHVDPAAAGGLVAAHRRGRVDLAHLRGRSNYPFAVQAAELALRRATGLDGIDDVAVVSRRDADDRIELVFAGPGGARWQATVETTHDPARPLTCHGAPSPPPRFAVGLAELR